MGVSLEIYRMRIGLFSHRGPRPCREKERMVQMKPAKRGHPWRLYLVTLYITLCYVALIIRLVPVRNGENFTQNKGVEVPTISTTKPVSLFTWERGMSRVVWQTGLPDTQASGGDIWRQVTAIGVNQLRFAGDVEENPGPPKIDLKSVDDLQIETVTETQIRVKWKDPYVGFVRSAKSMVKGLLRMNTNSDNYWFQATIKENDRVVKTFENLSDPHASFEDLRAYTEYEVSVVVAAEGSRQSKPEVKKITTDIGAPRNVTAEAHGHDKICVRWEHPDPPPTDYLLSVYREKDEKIIFENMPLLRTSKKYTFADLKEGTKYSIHLGAKKSTTKNFCKPVTCHTALLLPENIKSSYYGDVIKISWTRRPSHLQDEAIKYKIRWKREGENEFTTETFKGHSYNIKDLVPASTYTVQLSTVKDAYGYIESEVWTEPPLSTKPATVKEAQVLTTTETSITLSWDAVECDHYSLRLEEIADRASQNKFLEPIKVDKSQEMPIDLTDLKPGTPYIVRIEANFKGKISETCITAITQPEAPTDPEVKVNDTEALLKWSGPKFPAHSVVYEVEFVDAKGEMFNGRPFHCKEPHCEVDGLQESCRYDVSVYTVVQYQQKEERSKPLKTTVKTPLHGVDFRVVAKTERSITVHWTTDQHVPSTPPLQYVTFIRLGDTVRWYKKHGVKDNERTFDDLDMGTKYTVGICKGSGDDWSDPKEEDETTVLPPPSNIVVAEPQCNSASLTWEVGYNADMFVVEWWKEENKDQRQNYTRTSPDAVLAPLQPGTTYVVELSAKKNGVQSGSLLQEIVTKPMHPEKLTLESDVNEIRASWKKPKHGGVDDYEVTLVNNSSGTVVKTFTENGTATTISRLSPGTGYKVRIVANYHSISSDPREECIVTKPQPTAGLSTDEVTSDKVKVSWQPPQDQTGIIGYRLYCSTASPTQPRSEKDENNPLDFWTNERKEKFFSHVFPKLMPNTKYNITVWSIAGSRDHPVLSSPTSLSVTTDIPTVTDLRVTDYATTSISISWTAVKGGWFRSDPQICVHISAPDGPDETEKLLGGQSTKRFSDLRPATLYTIRVAVVGFMGKEGKPTTVTCPTRPRPITSISVSEQTTTAIKVQWSAAKDNDVTYMAQITGKDPILLGKDLACCFDELDPGTSYDISITVKHTFEDGTEVISRPCKTKASTCPARPEAVSIKSCSPSSITLAWKPPVSGNIDCYKVKIWCTDQTSTRSTEQKPGQSHSIGKHCSTKCTFDSLSPGSLHKITISSQFQTLSSEIVEIIQRTKLRSPDLKLREKTQTTVTVCWEHVKGEKEKYRLSISPDPNEGKPHVEIPCHENRLQHTFRNLVPGKEYKASAITIYEDAECEPCVLTIRTVVPPPENLTVIQQSITTHSFKIRWDHAVGEISGYIVRYTSQNHGQDRATLPLPKEHQQATLDNLTPGTMYSVSVSSKSGGEERTSDSCSVMQSTKVLPITESDVEVQTEPRRIHLSWKHPEGCVEKYILCSSHSNELSVSPPRHTKTYDNLVPGTKYTITLETESCDLRSGSPYHKEVVTDPLPPDIDTVIFEHIGTNNVVVKWCKPEGKADRYRLSIDERDCEYVQWDDMPTYTFSSLDPGQRHKLSMVSEILDGQQNIVSEPIEKTFYTHPLPPMNIEFSDISTQSFRVSWEPPSEGAFEKIRLGLSFGNNDPLYKSFQAGISTHEFTDRVSGRMYTVEICAESGDQLSETETIPIQTEMFPPTIRAPMSTISPTSITVQYKLLNTDCDKCIIQLSSVSTEDPNILKEMTKQDPQPHLDYTFDGLTPGEEYRILAIAHSGTKSKESKLLDVMTSLDTPKQIKVDKSFTSATISWSHAEGHKDGYTVRLSPSNGRGRKFVSKNDVLQAKFEDLAPGRKFDVKVTTTLKHQGREVKSIVCKETFRTDIMKPEKVIEGSIGQRNIDFSWIDVDGDRDAYCISIKHNEVEVGKKRKPAPGKRKSVLNESFTSLVPGSCYTLTIQTVSGNDKSEETPYTFWTMVAQPNIDKNLSSVDETSIHLLWKHSEGGWDDYEIEAENEETKERNPIKWACTERKEPKQLITNLVPGSWYVISIRAVRGEQRSTPVTARFRTLPNAPVDVNITPTSHEVSVDWNHPDGKNDGYIVKLCSEAETDKTVSVDSLSTSIHPFQHLEAGRLYTVVLWAVIKVDKRTERSKEVRRPVQTTISKPEILVLRKSETSIVLSWSDVDGDRTGYALSISPEDGDMPQRSTDPKTKEQLRTEPLYQEEFSSLCPGRVYTIRGFTESGTGKSKETVLEERTEVGEPKNPKVDPTLTTLELRWDPVDGDVDEYHVFLEPNDDPPSPVVLPRDHDTWHQFNGLEPGRLYKVTIVTLREGVKSKECVVEEQTIVAQPRNVQVEQAGDGALRLTWEEAEGDKNGYTLEISSASEVKPETRVSCSQPKRHEWTKLVPGSLYNITIKTTSHGRHSEPVTRQKRTIVARARNFAPEDVKEKSIAVSWTSALGEVDKYILQISDETWVDQVSITHSEGQMSYAFGDLVPGRQYNISIKTDREGEYSDEVPLPRVRTMVSKPVNLKVEDRQTDSLRVAWTSAEGDKDTYHIKIDPQEGNNPSAVLKRTDELTYTFTELTPGRLYTVRVVTDSGGDKSLAAEVKRRTLPSPPRAVEASVQGTGILVAWEPAIGDKDKYILKLFYHDKDTGKEADPIWREVEEGKPTQQIFPQLEFGRMYHVHVTTRTDDVDSEPAGTSRRMTVDRPKNVSVMHKTETTAIINWDHAQGDKDKYAVKIEPNSQAGYEKEVDQEQLTYGFDNLHPGRLHGLSVCTISGDDRSEPERTEFTTLARPPNKIHINKEDVKEKSLRVFWLEPESEVDHYGISISHSGIEISRHEISSSSCEYLFENLTPGRLYKISVWTYVGDLGSTSASTSVQERTLVASAKAIRVEDCTHSSISFSWDKADGDVDHYEYRVMHGTVCVNTIIMTQSSDQRSVQVDDLTGGRLYELVVVAVSGDRKSLPTKKNHRTKVHKPEGLQVADVKMQQVTITWRQAQGDKDKYTAAVFDTTRQDKTPKSIGDVSANASALEHRFSALVPGREYEIMLRTISGGDESDPEKRLVRTKPLRPVNVRTSAVDTGIMVEWSEPSGDKDEYVLEVSPEEDLHTPVDSVVISTGDATFYTFPGVTLGKLYDVKIFTRSKGVDSGQVIRQQRMTVGQPNFVQLEPSETSVNVTWDHAEGEKERYHITIWDVGRQECVWREERNVDEDLEVLFDALVSGRLYRVEVTTESGGDLSECVSETVRTKIRPPSEINIANNDVKENSIRITWRAPDCDMDRYHVSISPTDGVENAIGVVERDQPLEYTFHNLTSGREYELSVTTDSGGDKSVPVTTIKRTTVSRIELINVRERTETNLTIAWLDVKGDKSSYIASIREIIDKTPSSQRFPDIPAHSWNSQRFTNLTPGRMHEVSVVTVSGEMESLARTMLIRTIVSPPRNVMIPQDSVTEHSMDVVWEDARGDRSSYEHLISPKEGKLECQYMKRKSVNGTRVHRSRFENLVPGKIYTIELWTRQKEADSEVEVRLQRTKVAAVEENSIVFTNISENEITLGWKEAEGEKDGYTVTIHPMTDDTAAITPTTAEVKADDDLQQTFRDLTPGRKHAISIVTFKENDKSSEVTKTIHTRPNKPEGFDVKTFAESIAVSWNSPTGIQDGYVLKITTVPEDPEWFIKATFDEKTELSNDEGASVLDESNETRHFKYTFREKGAIKARTKYKISAQTKSGEEQNGGQCSDVIAFEERTKPHPPRDPRLVKEGIESVTFSWAPPIDEEQKRDIHRYIVKYKGPEEDDEREHDCQFNTSAKIEHLRDHTEYDFFIISVVETRAEDGTIERVDSERCRFTFKTMSQSTKIVRKFSKKLKKALFIVICGGAFAISLFTFLGVFVHNCVRPFGQSAAATVIPSTNSSNTPNNSSVRPTASAQSFNSGLAECFVEKAGEQFWYFVFFTAVPAICLIAIILWKVIKRIRQNIMPRATPDAERGLLEDHTEMTEMHPGEDIPKLAYGRNATRQRWLTNTT